MTQELRSTTHVVTTFMFPRAEFTEWYHLLYPYLWSVSLHTIVPLPFTVSLSVLFQHRDESLYSRSSFNLLEEWWKVCFLYSFTCRDLLLPSKSLDVCPRTPTLSFIYHHFTRNIFSSLPVLLDLSMFFFFLFVCPKTLLGPVVTSHIYPYSLFSDYPLIKIYSF